MMEAMRYSLALFAAGILFAQTSPLQITTSSLPAAAVGTSYIQQLATSGGTCQGTGTATSTIDSGALPAGLSVTSPTGVEQWSIQGTPIVSGTFTFKVHIFWTLDRRTPFVPVCTDDAVTTLTITVNGGQLPSTLAVDRTQVSTTYRAGHFPPPPETVQVTSTGVPAHFTVRATTNSGGPWLAVSTQSATTPLRCLSLFPSTACCPASTSER